MKMKEYENAARETKTPNAGLTYCVIGLGGEAGELQNKYKKVLRDDAGILTHTRRTAMIDELGDVLWYVSMLALELGTDLEMVAALNIKKLRARAEQNKIKGSGDDR